MGRHLMNVKLIMIILIKLKTLQRERKEMSEKYKESGIACASRRRS